MNSDRQPPEPPIRIKNSRTPPRGFRIHRETAARFFTRLGAARKRRRRPLPSEPSINAPPIQVAGSGTAGGEIWIRKLADGSRVAGLFNRGDTPADLIFRFDEAGVAGKWRARDLWQRKDAKVWQDQFTRQLAPHSASLIKLSPVFN